MLVASVFLSWMQSKNETEGPLELGKKMADSDMKRNPDASMPDFSPKPLRSYTQGLVTLANQRLAAETGEQECYE